MWCKNTSCSHWSEKKLGTSSIVTPPRLLRVIISIDPIEDGESEMEMIGANTLEREWNFYKINPVSLPQIIESKHSTIDFGWVEKVTHHRLNSDQSTHGPVIAQHMLPSSLLTDGNYECRADENNCKSFNLPQIKPHWKFDPIYSMQLYRTRTHGKCSRKLSVSPYQRNLHRVWSKLKY